MKVLFLTVSRIADIHTRGIYTDLMRKFRDEGHDVYIAAPLERRLKLETSLKEVDGVHILGVKTLNILKTNFVEKGIGTILLESQFKQAVKKYFSTVSFDLILYSTPPITFTTVVKMLKKRNPQAISYLLLKDIFPQNAVDLEMFSQQSLIYRYFRDKEILLYKHSDYIGCMSPANVEFVLKHNPFIPSEIVEVAPNSIELTPVVEVIDKKTVREKHGLPTTMPIFIYGGNLGKPQAIDFLISCLDANKQRKDCYFLVVGNGTEYSKIESWYNSVQPQNMKLISRLPKNDYDLLVQSCDVGLIFLDHRFTIPNYPSRLLSYLEYKMPIIAATDKSTDIGTLAEKNGYGYGCSSNEVANFTQCVDRFVSSPERLTEMGNSGYQFLLDHYLVEHTYEKIVSHTKNKR